MNDLSPSDFFSIRLPVEQPSRLVLPVSWTGHVPFASWLVAALRPRIIVELGVHTGTSYCAFCEEVRRAKLDTACYGIDTWRGDEHAGFYGGEVLQELRAFHDPLYGSFSTLIQSTFDESLLYFRDGSVDLLHIDGCHTYDAVKHDFNTWRPKLSNRAIVLFHDTNVHENQFGVWRFWEELKTAHHHFEFVHSHGLGVLAVGDDVPHVVKRLFELDSAGTASIRNIFASLGQNLTEIARLRNAIKTVWDEAKQSYEALSSTREAEMERLVHELENIRADAEQAAELKVQLRRRTEDAEHLTARLARAHARADEVEKQLQVQAAQRHATMDEPERASKAQASRHDAELQAVLQSTSWRITAPIRLVLERRRGLRRIARGSAKLVVWTLTGRLLSRLKLRRDTALIAKSGLFDPRWYVDHNPDVAQSGVDPLIHFVEFGGREGRDPSHLFRSSWYLEQHPDVSVNGTNPLIHYLRTGQAKGYAPKP
ncbi:class I SAM-dependent methyltransferase [Microvirga massiliensis]|uniref:class I SAM-dependent methyltransferase n=1 Tax=Microvirga massiliensis TaxID=1033741 RepID=UPI00069DA177|nr:class I SAM-dependent methyltransferase [Microvirga massiliensis]